MKKLLQSLFVMMLFAVTALAQERTITGTVVSSDDRLPIPGVSVKIKNTTRGTITDSNGKYTINAASNATLVFSSISYETVEVAVGNKTTISPVLSSDSKSLDEVVIQVPYGTVKKSAFTGAESTVGAAELAKTQMTSVTRALEGRVSGIVATNGGGQPGTNAEVRVRGIGSVNASSSPLYVLDGAVYNGSIVSIATDDIESVTVLKDAAATALYGSRAANGVIMIQTKTGKKGDAIVRANLRTGFMNRAIPQYDQVGAKDYYELMWEATRNRLQYASGQTPALAGQNASATLTGANVLVYNAYNVPGAQLVDPVTGKLNPNASLLWDDNWNTALFNTDALRQDYNVSISGASDKTDYYFSGGYVNEEGITKFTEYDRFTTRLNINTKIKSWLKGGTSLDAAISYQRNNVASGTATTNPFYYSTMMGPIYPVYERTATGAFVIDPTTGGNKLDWGNPNQMGARPYAPNSNLLGSLDLDDRSNRPVNINNNTYLEASFLKDFKFRTSIATTYYDASATTFQNSLFGDAQNVAGRSTKSDNRQLTFTFNQVLSYAKNFGDHNVSALVGHENFKFRQNFMSATRTGFPFPGTSELTSAAVAEGSTSYQRDHAIESYFSRVDYDYKSRYYISGSLRSDGSSRFSPQTRWGTFYSVSGAWRASEESFLKSVSWINDLKLRVSYGELGNENLDSYYAYQALYGLGWNNVGFPGAIVGTLATPELTWEKNQTTNIGVDFSFFNNRLQGSVELYDKVSDNLLFDVPLPTSTGITTVTRNIGALSNKGIDVTLGYTAVKKTDFDWRIDLNLTHFKNKFKELSQPEIISGNKKYVVGGGIYDFFIREFAGVDPATGLGMWKQDVLGTNGLPTGQTTTTTNFTNGTQYISGTALPDLTGGITNSFRYGNFDLSFLFTFQLGGKFYDGNYAGLMHVGSYGTAWHTDILNRWTTPGQITDVPRVQNAVANQSGASTRFLFDADYLNLKNVTLGYTIPQSFSGKIGLKSAKIFANLDNGYLWHKGPKGMNPQGSFSGNTDYVYPTFRTFSLGLNVNL
ncbi:TonB-dependent receptor [Pedobacter aquatilis]|uniref:SusC/RagA family TonB-linked outer membrane protein n=1 Tax=Pedobacter aquatilis TaxID=351343 RepID=UPI0025B5F033|nr:TonB-dependent receptor [Pedobacter aquatilis]MDN3586991.1 TonB-dependent receptor [Pedobacter aquatilis]